jgi:hypothetical protein
MLSRHGGELAVITAFEKSSTGHRTAASKPDAHADKMLL